MAEPCEFCERPSTAASCTADWYGLPFSEGSLPRCRDCNVIRGGFHHPGCVVAQCVDGCGDQAFGSAHLVEH
jgi:hypothetical protein